MAQLPLSKSSSDDFIGNLLADNRLKIAGIDRHLEGFRFRLEEEVFHAGRYNKSPRKKHGNP